MNRSKDILRKLLDQIRLTQERELDCGEVFHVLDQYTEAVAAGQDPKVILPLVQQHLELCPDCFEEYEALLRVLQIEH
jgi:hypothetical protein